MFFVFLCNEAQNAFQDISWFYVVVSAYILTTFGHVHCGTSLSAFGHVQSERAHPWQMRAGRGQFV